MIDEVILVNKDDQELGTCEKMEAHKLGLMHRAFSVLLYNSKGEMLLQQRASHKYHSAGLWSNACCSHPRPGESMEVAVARRLQEELGVVCKVKEIDRFVYQADFENGLQEHELDYVFKGLVEELPEGNPEEVQAMKFMNQDEMLADMKAKPMNYTVWFRLIMERLTK